MTLPLIKAITPAHVELKIVDEYIDQIDFTERVNLVGITGLTMQIKRGYEIADKFREKGVKVVMGGMHVSALPEEALEHADSVVIGEAENVWEEVIRDFENRRMKSIYRCNELFDLKKSIFPDFSPIDFNRYLRPPFSNRPIFPIQTTRGCPHSCKFCSVTAFFGGTFRTKPIDLVRKEIKHYIATYDTRYYFFVDDNIIGQPTYARELFKALIPLKIRWLGQFCTTILKFPDLARLAADSGCTSAYLGIESLSRSALESVNKGFNKVEEYVAVFKLLNSVCIRPFASLILGFDDDNEDTFDKTVNFLIKNKVGKAYFYILTPFPGTKIYQEMKEQGRVITDDWNKYDCTHVVFKHTKLSAQQLEDGLWKAHRRFFGITRILTRNLKYAFNNPIKYSIFLFYDLHDRRMILKKRHPINESGKLYFKQLKS